MVRHCEKCGKSLKKYQHICVSCRKEKRLQKKETKQLRQELTDKMKDRSRKDPLLEWFKEVF